jgi:hypothetical protein
MQGRIGSIRDAGPAGPSISRARPAGASRGSLRDAGPAGPSMPAVQDSNVQKKITNHLHHAQLTSSVHNKTAQTPFSNQPMESPRETSSIHRGQPLARPVGHGPAGSIGMATVSYSTYGQTSQGERRSAEARNQTTTVGYQNQTHSLQLRRVGNDQSASFTEQRTETGYVTGNYRQSTQVAYGQDYILRKISHEQDSLCKIAYGQDSLRTSLPVG